MAVAAAPVRAAPSRGALVAAAWALVGALPLIGLVSLLMHSKLDPKWDDPKLHFVVFGVVAGAVLALASAAGEAARRRADARVMLISLAFLATGAFLGLHALGTAGVLFDAKLAGFKVAIPVGLLVASVFAAASAFVDIRPGLAARVVRRQGPLPAAVLAVAAIWFAVTVAEVPPLNRPTGEGGTGSLLAILAAIGTVVYAVSAARYLALFRGRPGLLPASIVACFVLLAEAMIGVAVTGERAWHASWWEWHALIVLAFLLVGYAAHREWSDERFRQLYLPATRERAQEVSVLFGDLAGFTSFSERSPASEVAAMLKAYFEIAAPLLSQRFGGQVEKFIGDAVVATFNTRGDQPDHALRAARAALALQEGMARLGEQHPDWPRLRIGVNSGPAVLRELGGEGHVTYAFVGDTINLGARLEAAAPVGGVLIGAETYRRLPGGAVAEPRPGLRVKGREATVDAFVLHAVG